MIIITTSSDNIQSKVFNRFLERVPTGEFRIIFSKEDQETTYHKVLGAVCQDDEEDYVGLTD
jgi:hypothetical protein